MSEMGKAKMQLARRSAEGVTANTETEGNISDKNREWLQNRKQVVPKIKKVFKTVLELTYISAGRVLA